MTAAGVAPKIPNVPRRDSPKPVPGPIEHAVQPGGTADWKALLTQIGPLLASLALHEPAQRTGFLNGYMQGHSLGNAAGERKRTAATQAKNQAAANYPARSRDSTRKRLTIRCSGRSLSTTRNQSGVSAGLLKPGDLASPARRAGGPAGASEAEGTRRPSHDAREERLQPRRTRAGGATIKLNDGQTCRCQTALDLTRERPLECQRDTDRETAGDGEDGGRTLPGEVGEGSGKTVDTLTSAEELQAKTEYANAGRDRSRRRQARQSARRPSSEKSERRRQKATRRRPRRSKRNTTICSRSARTPLRAGAIRCSKRSARCKSARAEPGPHRWTPRGRIRKPPTCRTELPA
jgi:hypothetical protein